MQTQPTTPFGRRSLSLAMVASQAAAKDFAAKPDASEAAVHKWRLFRAVGSHLGLRISNFAPKKPLNVRISTKDILTFDGFASSLERQAGLSRIGVRTLFAPVGSSHPEQR